LDLVAVHAGSYYYGDQLPARGGDTCVGVVTPGTSCTDGCPGGPTNNFYFDIYVGSAAATPSPTPGVNTKCNDDKSGGNSEKCASCAGGAADAASALGMATYSVHSMLVSLNIQDTPLHYSPAYGPGID